MTTLRTGPAALRVVLLAIALLAAPLRAQPPAVPDTPAGAALQRLVEWLNGRAFEEPAAFFEESFLEAIPPERLVQVRAMLLERVLGEGEVTLVRIEQQLNTHELDAILVGAKGSHIRCRLGLDHTTGLMNRLNFTPAPELDDTAPRTWDQFADALRALPGRVGFGAWEIRPDDAGAPALHPIAEVNPDEPLAVGSAFKLYVLGALGEQVAAGQRAWLDTIEVDDALKSLPSGMMQTLPAGTTLTLDAVARDMIRISDNTATDHLMALVGRDAIEAYTLRHDPDAGAWFPFLTTMEMFAIKLCGDDALMERYARATTDERRAMIAPGGAVEQAQPSLLLAAAWTSPRAIDTVEWFASARTLARLHAALEQMGEQRVNRPLAAALRANPGLPFPPETWTDIAYKGGSEPGVICFAWRLERADGRAFALIMTWNDTAQAVDEARFAELALLAGTLLAQTP